MRDVVQLRPEGLYCPAGQFYIDPWRPVATAVLTHGHGDHARVGMGCYHTSAEGLPILQWRLGEQDYRVHAYGQPFTLGNARVSLHPAGHVLGSAQVRIEADGQTWVVSGDYKRQPDPTCSPFEVVPCDTFITEATFGLPIYRWPSAADVARDIVPWRDLCAARGEADTRLVIDADGKSQAAAGFAGELVIAPPSAAGSAWLRRFRRAQQGFASGWMRLRGNCRRRNMDRGFVVSDHADWPDLLRTIHDTGARRVIATHGDTDALVRTLNEAGVAAETLATQYGEDD